MAKIANVNNAPMFAVKCNE